MFQSRHCWFCAAWAERVAGAWCRASHLHGAQEHALPFPGHTSLLIRCPVYLRLATELESACASSSVHAAASELFQGWQHQHCKHPPLTIWAGGCLGAVASTA